MVFLCLGPVLLGVAPTRGHEHPHSHSPDRLLRGYSVARDSQVDSGGRRPSVHSRLPHHLQAHVDRGCRVRLGLSPSQLLLPGGRGQIGLFWGRRRFHPAALVLGGPEWFWSLRLTTGRGSLAGPPFEGDWIPEGLMFTVRGR